MNSKGMTVEIMCAPNWTRGDRQRDFQDHTDPTWRARITKPIMVYGGHSANN